MSVRENAKLILVRHAEIDQRFHDLCYGRSDISLSALGQQRSLELVERLAQYPATQVVHSDLARTRYLAELLATRLGLEAASCEELKERDFGSWELLPWDDIYAQSGDDMNQLVSQPASFRPGGGETTYEMRDRVVRWYGHLGPDQVIVAVTHGGPIAALLGTLQQRPVAEWLSLIPGLGQFVVLEKEPSGNPCQV